MRLVDLFDASLLGRPDDTALEVDTPGGVRTLTFGELDARSNRVARVLRRRGLAMGDRLAVCLTNRLEFIDLFLAAAKLGLILVPINVLYREREIAHLLGDSDPALVVASGDAAALMPRAAPLADVEDLAEAAAAEEARDARARFGGDTPAALVYTSGTTGRSKGAVLTHDNLLANAANLVACWRITAADRYLAVLPLFHVHGLGNGLVTWLASGCRMRLAERFDARTAEVLFDGFAPTLFFGVPTIYVRLLELPPEPARRIGAGMRLFVSGSAPLPAAVHEAFRARFGHVILERYGMTETLMTLSNPYGGERRAGTVGFPLPGISTRIVGAAGEDVGANEVGELLVKGPTVFPGYWRQPHATAAAFVDGWFRTGDLAERSDDGYFALRGRRTDLIISGGFNIYPREVEDVLLEAPGVREAAVVGEHDPRRGEVPVAYLVTDGPLDAGALDRTCRRALASFKVPRRFVRVDSLPRNALGKIQKHLLGGTRG